ncbi:Maltodextrin glucosidase [Cellulomonas sp. T2.31MG-18]|uniref:glycoside hydrolase family 13 protein n=1 Tax=Cellulomonas sp. T2.31MG-18 TaxID=3157619 RepID=UPI0035EF5119
MSRERTRQVPRHRLDRPHHDGSALHVAPGTPALGDAVPVRVRVPAHRPVDSVWVRVLRDGEPVMVPARADGGDGDERWFTADVTVHNPVTGYRWLLDEPGGARWLNGTGLHARDVTDAADFRLSVHPPAPSWTSSAVVYQVFPDRFARADGYDGPPVGGPSWAEPMAWDVPPAATGRSTGRQLYGGDLRGIAQRLDHLERLGVDTVYLTPVFPARSVHRYDATSFDHVDPLLGGDQALAGLSRAVHERGMRLVGDLTTNHTGAGHDWFEAARADRSAPEASLYYWTDTEPGYVGWLGHPSLPKLNYGADSTFERMVSSPGSVTARWLREPYALDGWRVDVANMTGRHGSDDLTHRVAREMRATMSAVSPETVLVAEHFHDAGEDLRAGGWQAAMNYAGFATPVGGWLVDPSSGLTMPGMPVPRPRRRGKAMVATMREVLAGVPWSVAAHQWNLLGSHDTPRIRTLAGSAAAVEVAAGLLFTYPGTPMVFAGDEGGLTGSTGEAARVPMPWADIDGGGSRWDRGTFDVYRRLIEVRRGSRALREGGLRWAVVHDDAVAFLRETADERVLVLVARGRWPGAALPPTLLAAGAAPQRLYGGGELEVRRDGLVLPGDGPAVHVWRLS